MIIAEAKPTERRFNLEVSEEELQLIERALYNDTPTELRANTMNGALYREVINYMRKNKVSEISHECDDK